MLRSRYTPDELRHIGEQNANRLPPATACLGMYEYELKRAAEQESLFNSALTQAARVAKEVADQQHRIDSLEKTIKERASHHGNEGVISLSAVRAIYHGLQSFTPSDSDSKAILMRTTWLMNELKQEAISTEDQIALTAVLSATYTHESKMEHQQNVQHLRDEHVAVANDVRNLEDRVSKLEDLVHVLTPQKAAAPFSTLPAQLIEVNTKNGQNLDLSVPKGMALVPHKPSRSSSLAPTNRTADSTRDSIVTSNGQSAAAAIADPTPSIAKQSTTLDSKTNEQPLPPVPAALGFPDVLSNVRKTQSKDTQPEIGVKKSADAHKVTTPSAPSMWDSATPTQAHHKPAVIHNDAAAPEVGDWVTSLPNELTMQPVQPDSQAQQQANTQPPPSVTRKAKTKWKDPPLFNDDSPSEGDAWKPAPLAQSNESTDINDPSKTLFSLENADASVAKLRGSPLQHATEQAKPSLQTASSYAALSSNVSDHSAKHQAKHVAGWASTNSNTDFAEVSKVVHGKRQVDENKPPQGRTPQPAFTADAMKAMLKDITPQPAHGTEPASKVGAQESMTAAPRAPVSMSKGTFPTTLSGAMSPAPAEAGQPAKPFRFATKSSAIRKVVETAPTSSTVPDNQVVVKQEVASPKSSATASSSKLATPVPIEQQATKLEVNSPKPSAAVFPSASSIAEVNQRSISSTTSTVASFSSPLTPGPTVNPTASAFAARPIMNAQAPTFQHSAAMPRASPLTDLSASTNNPSAAGSSAISKLRKSMTPDLEKSFMDRVKSTQR